MNCGPVERKTLFLYWRPNRSLSRNGRLLWIGLIASTTATLAVGAAALGAWMVLPFAGAEVLLVWRAFSVIAKHDGDYEMLRISDQEFSWECSDQGRVCSLQGNRAWVKVVGELVGGKFELGLSYAGKRVPLASLLSDEERRSLSQELQQILG